MSDYYIATLDSSAADKAQANEVVNGANDRTRIDAAVHNYTHVVMFAGTYDLNAGGSSPMMIPGGVHLEGRPGSIFYARTGSAGIHTAGSMVKISGMTCYGHVWILNSGYNDFTCENVSIDQSLDGKTHELFTGGCTGVFRCNVSPNANMSNITFKGCTAARAFHHGFNLNLSSGGQGTNGNGYFRNITFENCKAISCGAEWDPSWDARLPNGVTRDNIWNPWATGYDIPDAGNVEGMTLINCEAIDSYQSGFHIDGSWTPDHVQICENVKFINCISKDNGWRSAGKNWPEAYQCGYYLQNARMEGCISSHNKKAGFLFKNEEAGKVYLKDCIDRGSAYSFVTDYTCENATLINCLSDGATRRAIEAVAVGGNWDVTIINYKGSQKPVVLGLRERIDYVDTVHDPPGSTADHTVGWYRTLSTPFTATLRVKVVADLPITPTGCLGKNAKVTDLCEKNPWASSTVDFSKISVSTIAAAPVGAPGANFTANPITGTAPVKVQFTDQTTGDPIGWQWDFMNLSITDSIEKNPSFTYTVPGVYPVKLLVTSANGTSELIRTDYITVTGVAPPVIVDIVGSMIIDKPGTYRFTQNLSGMLGGPAIRVLCGGVTIDGGGFTFSGTDVAGSAGIFISSSAVQASGVTIKDLNIDHFDHGIYYYVGSSAGVVTGCTITDCNNGIVLTNGGNGSTILGNTISECSVGIMLLWGSGSITLKGNVVRNCTNGLFLSDNGGNTIINNQFCNPLNVYFASNVGKSIWYLEPAAGPNLLNGPNTGGNYWGSVDGSGFSDNAPDTDRNGFADTAYTIRAEHGEIDAYPMVVYTPPNSTDITGPVKITVPGTYTVIRDFTVPASSSIAIEIACSDVVIRGNGKTITGHGGIGDGGYGSAAVFVSNSITTISGIVILDLKITNWFTGISLYKGSKDILVEGCKIENCSTYGIQIWKGGSGSSIIKNTLVGSSIGLYLNEVTGVTIYNNLFRNSVNVLLTGTAISTLWNVPTPINALNLIGGPSIGGNYWGTLTAGGFSDKANDANHNGFADQTYSIGAENGGGVGDVDQYPMVMYIPPNSNTITGPTTISTPGTYTLGNDISYTSGDVITITCSNVILDGANYSITGAGMFSSYIGVRINSTSGTATGVQIKNLKISGLGFAIKIEGSVTDPIITGCTITLNLYGIALAMTGSRALIQKNTIQGNNHGLSMGTVDGVKIYDNMLCNEGNLLFVGVGTVTNTVWSLPAQAGLNIVGGPSLGGNYWGDEAGTCLGGSDSNGDGFGDVPYSIPVTNGTAIDPLPLVSVASTSPTPTALFSAVPTKGNVPLEVQFTNQSSGNPISWAWDFTNDGTTDSTLRNPTWIYTEPGTYPVKLTVTNAFGSDTLIKQAYISVTKQAVVANFSATPADGAAPLSVSFTDLTEGNPTSWAWDFGDGSTSVAKNPVHIYKNPGIYPVSLTGKNAAGETDMETKAGFITVTAAAGSNPAAIETQFQINGPTVITKPGTYALMKDILNCTSDSCIRIECSGVTLYGNGHTISGTLRTGTAGVLVYSAGPTTITNIIVQNLKITGWTYGVSVMGQYSGKTIISRCTISGNWAGVYFNGGGVFSTVLGCAITGNTPTGIRIENVIGVNIYNNLLCNSQNIEFVGNAGGVVWTHPNTPPGTNILGGPTLGGNYWGSADSAGNLTSTGFSDTAVDTDQNGFSDTPFRICEGDSGLDYRPLVAYVPPGLVTMPDLSLIDPVSTYQPHTWFNEDDLNKEYLNHGETQYQAILEDAAAYFLPRFSQIDAIIQMLDAAVPVGSAFVYPVSGVLPSSLIDAQGQYLQPGDYPELFAVFGRTYGSDANGGFRIPNLMGKMIFGLYPDNQVFDKVDKEGGSEVVALRPDQNGQHIHPLDLAGYYAPKTPTTPNVQLGYLHTSSGGYNPAYLTGDAGKGEPHNNLSPYAVARWVIRARGGNGMFVTTPECDGTGDGQFIHPRGISVDSGDNVFVVDVENSRVQKFLSDGTFVVSWGSRGGPSNTSRFMSPEDICIDGNENVYVTDTGSQRTKKYTSDGEYLATLRAASDWRIGEVPNSIDVDYNGNIYVGEVITRHIYKFNPACTHIKTFGPISYVPQGQYDTYPGILVDASGNMVVVDDSACRIRKYSPTGAFISEWGNYGFGDADLEWPHKLFVGPGGNYYVTEKLKSETKIFTPTGVYLGAWTSPVHDMGENGYFISMNYDASGNLYVADYCSSSGVGQRIQKFSPEGVLLLAYTKPPHYGSYGPGFDSLQDIAVGPTGTLYALDNRRCQVLIFNTAGVYVSSFGNSYSPKSGVVSPRKILTDSVGNVYVSDPARGRVVKFTSTGTFLWSAKNGSYGTANGQMSSSTGMVLDSANNLYIADNYFRVTKKFDPNGVLLGNYPWTVPMQPGEFGSATGLSVSRAGNMYLVDERNNQVQKFTVDGVLLEEWGSLGIGDEQFNHPCGIAVNINETFVYVADTDNHRIVKYTSSGVFIQKWGSEGSEDGLFNHPEGVAVDSTGSVYVSDSGNHRVQKFTAAGKFITKWGGSTTTHSA